MTLNIPNALSLLRIAIIPICVFFYYLPVSWGPLVAAIIFILAAFTDWLDGFLARHLKLTTRFGAFLDPVADKLMVAAALIVLVEFERIGAVIALIIIGREIAVSALREWMAGAGERSSVAVAQMGKIKTAAQMLAILLLLYYDKIGSFNTKLVGEVLIIFAAFLTLLSMAYYLKAAWPALKKSID